MIYHAMIEVDLEADDMDDATRLAVTIANCICEGSCADCARVKSVTEHCECARPGCDRRVAHWGTAYCGAACSAQRKEPICTCEHPDRTLAGCPIHEYSPR